MGLFPTGREGSVGCRAPGWVPAEPLRFTQFWVVMENSGSLRGLIKKVTRARRAQTADTSELRQQGPWTLHVALTQAARWSEWGKTTTTFWESAKERRRRTWRRRTANRRWSSTPTRTSPREPRRNSKKSRKPTTFWATRTRRTSTIATGKKVRSSVCHLKVVVPVRRGVTRHVRTWRKQPQQQWYVGPAPGVMAPSCSAAAQAASPGRVWVLLRQDS